VVKGTQPGSVTVVDERDDGQLTLLAAISAFGDSIPPVFITNNKTFDETALADQQLYHEHNYVMRTADKTFITEVLFIDWLETQFIPKNYQLRQKANHDGPIILLLAGQSCNSPRIGICRLPKNHHTACAAFLAHHSTTRFMCIWPV
jgi:hypothetical protein